MQILLIRHPESEKNRTNSFASSHGNEELTDEGRAQLTILERSLEQITRSRPELRFGVFCADTVRSSSASQRIAETLAVPFTVISELASVNAGVLAGTPENIVQATHPEYFKRLELYRAGALSSYLLDGPGETTRDFEKRVRVALAKIEHASCDVAVVVAHKSSITASVIHYARLFNGYPSDFFGFVEIPTGTVTVVEVDSASQKGALLGVGRGVQDLFETFRPAVGEDR